MATGEVVLLRLQLLVAWWVRASCGCCESGRLGRSTLIVGTLAATCKSPRRHDSSLRVSNQVMLGGVRSGAWREQEQNGTSGASNDCSTKQGSLTETLRLCSLQLRPSTCTRLPPGGASRTRSLHRQRR